MDLQIFKNEEFGELRTLTIDGVPYFVGKDAATNLGYVNPRDALAKHVDAEDKRESQIATPSGVQTMTVINESGLYSLILSSKLPTAKKFKHWVTSEVLPAIRKYGVYATEDFIKQAIADPKFAIDILSALQAERDKVAVLTQQVAELQPKASYYDVVLNCKDLVSVSKIAKDYGMSAVAFNKLLHKLGVQFKQGDIWLLYQQYARLGWTSTKTLSYSGDDGSIHSRIHMYWTQKGRLGLYDFLKYRGYLPTIEVKDNYTSDGKLIVEP